MADFIEISAEAGVLTVRMNRPEKKNALTAAMYQGLADALDEAAARDDIRCTLILGTPGAFSAGNDIGDFLKVAMSGQRDSMAVFEFLERIILAKKPVAAGVDGLAIGVGVTMLMHCDHVVASARSTFRTPFVDLGLLPEAGSSLILPQLAGYQQAAELILLGRPFDAARAQAMGLVNGVVPEDRLLDTALEAARALAAQPPGALRLARSLLKRTAKLLADRVNEEMQLFGECLASPESKEAMTAFFEKRKPDFSKF